MAQGKHIGLHVITIMGVLRNLLYALYIEITTLTFKVTTPKYEKMYISEQGLIDQHIDLLMDRNLCMPFHLHIGL